MHLDGVQFHGENCMEQFQALANADGIAPICAYTDGLLMNFINFEA